MKNKKEIVVVSGKGGTGKTTITACLAEALGNKIIADADVDAANLHILLKPENIKGSKFRGKPIASIDTDVCTSCGLCQELCRFNAIDHQTNAYKIDDISCDGCGLCKIACPVNAIEMNEQIVGEWFTAGTEWGDFAYARLIPGAENSGNLVTMVRHQANLMAREKKIKTILIDGPPGIGCPVIAAISGSDLAIIVTEPTVSGISDFERIYGLTEHFNIPAGIVINRFDINLHNTKKIEEFAEKKGIKVFARIPHSDCIMREIAESSIPFRKCKSLYTEIVKIKEIIEQDSL